MNKNQNRLNFVGLLFLTFLMTSSLISAQNDTIYFNENWVECSKDKSAFYRLYHMQDSIIRVEDYYLNDQLQASGLVRNTKEIILKLNYVGDLTGAHLGEWQSFTKRGKLVYTVNYTPFDAIYGVGSEKINLLDSLDTVEADIQNLRFQTSYFARRTEYGFLLEDDVCHGHWTRIISKNGQILKRAHNYKNELNGEKTEYYRSGTIREKSFYKDDALHGEKKRYNRKGRLVEGKVYEDGKLIETWRYHKPKK